MKLQTDAVESVIPHKRSEWRSLPALSSVLPSSCLPLAQRLMEIETVTVAVVNLEYEGSILPVEVRSWTLNRFFFTEV